MIVLYTITSVHLTFLLEDEMFALLVITLTYLGKVSFVSDDNQRYDKFIVFLPCHVTTTASVVKAQRPTIFITDFPCGPCFMDRTNCNATKSLHMSLFPSCADIVHMLRDVLHLTDWTKTTILFNDISGMYN